MPTEQLDGTTFGNGDQIDLHRGNDALLAYEAVHSFDVPVEGIAEPNSGDATRERAKVQAAEFLKTHQGQIRMVSGLARELRLQAAADSQQKPLDSRRDIGTNEGYEFTE